MANFQQMFGKYELIQRLAFGGMAEIFLAKMKGARGFEREVVIKRLLPQYSYDEEFIKMFQDEARILSKLHHSNIVQVIEFDQVGEDYYLAMEYISGCDLRDLLFALKQQQTNMPFEHFCFILNELCQGLFYAHHFDNINIVHRDISPHNVFLSWSGDVKIGDFGIAKASNRFHRTATGILKGKVCYMSPEQAKGLSLDERSDIFALGIVCYEMLTNEKLFEGLSEFEILEKIKTISEDTVISSPKVPDIFKVFLHKVLHPNADLRFQTMNEVKQALLVLEIEHSFRHDKDSYALWLKDLQSSITQKKTSHKTKILAQNDESASLPMPQLFTEMSDTVEETFKTNSENSVKIITQNLGETPVSKPYQTDSTTLKLSDELRTENPFDEQPETNTLFRSVEPEIDSSNFKRQKKFRRFGIPLFLFVAIMIVWYVNSQTDNTNQIQEVVAQEIVVQENTVSLQNESDKNTTLDDNITIEKSADVKKDHVEVIQTKDNLPMNTPNSETSDNIKLHKPVTKTQNKEIKNKNASVFKNIVTETKIKPSQEQQGLLNAISDNMGLIEIQSVPVWLKVYREGEFMGTTPLTMSLPEGKYTVHLENNKVAIASSLEFHVSRKKLIRKSIQVY